MRKKIYFSSLLTALVISLYVLVPVTAIDSPAGWSHTPITDATDDVWQHSSGVQGDFHDEIDIINVSVVSGGIRIVMEDVPGVDPTRPIIIYVDNNTDNNADFIINHSGTTNYIYYVIRQHDNMYWDGSAWGSDPNLYNITVSVSVPGQSLFFPSLVAAIPCLPCCRIGVESKFSTLFTDYAAYDPTPGGGIPGFALVLTLFSLLTLLAIVFFRQRKLSIF